MNDKSYYNIRFLLMKFFILNEIVFIESLIKRVEEF
jgi:hypothetical protein